MQISEVADIRDISRAAWSDLCACSPEATVFQSYEWLCAWWRCFGEENSFGRILLAHEGERLVGAMPLYQTDVGEGRRPRAVLKLLGSEHADYQCLLFEKGRIDVAEGLLNAGRGIANARCDLLLEELPKSSTFDQLVVAMQDGSGGSVISLNDPTPCPRLAIAGNDLGVEAVLRKKSLQRHRKRLADQGMVKIQHLSEPGQIKPYLPVFFDQHVCRWRATEYPSLFEKERNRAFYTYLAESLGEKSQVLFSVLSVDEAPVAFHFGLVSRNDLIWYKPSFELTWSKFSPGEVLLKHLIEHAVERRFDFLDFTRGDESFKSRFSSEVRYNSSYLITTRKWYGRYRALRACLGRLRRKEWRRATKQVALGGSVSAEWKR